MPEVLRVWNETRGETLLHSLVGRERERERASRKTAGCSWWLRESAGAFARALVQTRIVRSTIERRGGERANHCDSRKVRPAEWAAGERSFSRRDVTRREPSASFRADTLNVRRVISIISKSYLIESVRVPFRGRLWQSCSLCM